MPKKQPTQPPRRIALAFPNTLVAAGSIMQGLLEYAHTRGGWSFTQIPEQISPSCSWLSLWHGDGAFVTIFTSEESLAAQALPFPVVNLSGYFDNPQLPTVTHDHRAIGQLQARHLLERRFSRLAYYGVSDLWYSRERLAGFQEEARRAGAHVTPWLVPSGLQARRRWANQLTELTRLLGLVKLPFAVAASTDLRACMILEACRTMALRIPEDIAVVGVDNDPTLAPFATPPLSSVARNDRELGFRAAQMLDFLIEGRKQKSIRALIPSSVVVERHSTETLMVENPETDKLIHAIREHIGEPFGVEFLIARSPLSRSSLENLFKRDVGCSPYTLINRLRVEHASRLLTATSSQKLTAVAAACGFTDLRHFRLVFQRHTGRSPAAFRKQSQAERHSVG